MKKHATIQSVADTCWHVERKINELLERVMAVEAALLGLADDPSMHGPNPGDDDWIPDKQSLIHPEGLRA